MSNLLGVNKDPYLRPARVEQIEPRRVVVELEPEDFIELDRASGHWGPALYLRAVALERIRRG